MHGRARATDMARFSLWRPHEKISLIWFKLNSVGYCFGIDYNGMNVVFLIFFIYKYIQIIFFLFFEIYF